jgi:chemotaxis protein MotA
MKTFMSLSEMVRREGLLSLEHELETRELSEFAVTGLRLVIDGADEEVIEQALNTRVENLEHRHEQGAAVFEAAAGYAPTMGVLGTVMGMVNVLSDLSNAEELGPKIAVAFIATLYGVGSANLIFMPIANKLKVKSAEEIIAMNMTMEGILLLRSGCNPAFMKEQMKGYLKNEKETEETEA